MRRWTQCKISFRIKIILSKMFLRTQKATPDKSPVLEGAEACGRDGASGPVSP